jgi:hypothetical protein
VSNNTPGIVDDALRLARYGRPVFPCRADKKPYTLHGFQDASTDAHIIRTWWRQWPDALVAVPTGEASGLFVIDLDGARHVEAKDWLERYSPYLPETRQHATKSGGCHLLFKHQSGLRNSTSKLAKGVDTRGEGGYICWWPFHLGLNAPHKLGNPLAELPEWLAEELKPPPAKVIPFRPVFGKQGGSAYRKVHGILNAVATAREGERNSLVYWGACRITDMIVNRELGSTEGASSFQSLYLVSINLGLPEREVARTIQSAVR